MGNGPELIIVRGKNASGIQVDQALPQEARYLLEVLLVSPFSEELLFAERETVGNLGEEPCFTLPG